MPGKLDVRVLTAEGELFDSEAEFVVVPASEGELGVLPEHSPIVATLKSGSLRVTHGSEEDVLFVSGGFVDVAPFTDGVTVVTVLADTGEHAHDIDEARAQEARRRAQELLAQRVSGADYAEAVALLERSSQRIRVAEIGRSRRSRRERPVRS